MLPEQRQAIDAWQSPTELYLSDGQPKFDKTISNLLNMQAFDIDTPIIWLSHAGLYHTL